MVEAGYDEAVGTFNWIDDHYVATYRFRKGSLKENQIFTIGAEDLARQVMSNPKLKEIVSDGSYLYVDSHLVLASNKWLFCKCWGLTDQQAFFGTEYLCVRCRSFCSTIGYEFGSAQSV